MLEQLFQWVLCTERKMARTRIEGKHMFSKETIGSIIDSGTGVNVVAPSCIIWWTLDRSKTIRIVHLSNRFQRHLFKTHWREIKIKFSNEKVPTLLVVSRNERKWYFLSSFHEMEGWKKNWGYINKNNYFIPLHRYQRPKTRLSQQKLY